MGWAARANPDSTDGKDERRRTEITLRRFVRAFPTRQAFDAYCESKGVTAEERIYLETLLPAHLTVASGEVQ